MNAARDVPELRTGRLLLRPIQLSDSKAFLDIFSDAETMKYWSSVPIHSLEEAESLVRSELEWVASGMAISWGIALPDSNCMIGKIILFQFSEQNRRAEAGYILDRRQWGKGFMTEALQCVLDYAFDVLRLHRIEADTDPANTASLTLLEKAGFLREGLFRDRWLTGGKWYDSVMLGLVRDEWKQKIR